MEVTSAGDVGTKLSPLPSAVISASSSIYSERLRINLAAVLIFLDVVLYFNAAVLLNCFLALFFSYSCLFVLLPILNVFTSTLMHSVS